MFEVASGRNKETLDMSCCKGFIGVSAFHVFLYGSFKWVDMPQTVPYVVLGVGNRWKVKQTHPGHKPAFIFLNS